jgi:2'-5' RNA ligase
VPSRCFVAVTLSTDAVALLGDARLAFLETAPEWAGEKWVRPENLHLTLKFAGALPDPALEDVLHALRAVCAEVAAFRLTLASVRATPSPQRAQTLWSTLEGDTGTCADLALGIDGALVSGFHVQSDTRTFRPHVTLARARAHRRAPLDAIAAATSRIASGKETDRSVSVHSVTLLSSTLGPGGPHYESLGSAPLRG